MFWSESDNNSDSAIRIFGSKSTDNGVTWSAAVALSPLTDNTVASDVFAFQIDLTSISSDIGVYYARYQASASGTAVNNTTFRMSVDTSLAVTSAGVSAGVTNQLCTNIIRNVADNGFVMYYLQWGAIPGNTLGISAVTLFRRTSATWNGVWSAGAITQPFTSPNRIYEISVIRVSDTGHLLIATYETAIGTNSDATADLGRNIRTDIAYTYSTDNGSTWTAITNLTNYSGTISNVSHIPVARNIRLLQRANGNVAIAFAEMNTELSLNRYTTPTLVPSNTLGARPMAYHTSKNMTFITYGATGTAGQRGLWVIDWTAGTATRLTTLTTPALPSNSCEWVSLSADGNRLAIGTAGGLAILNISDPTIANWTVTTFSTISTPAIRDNNVTWVEFETDSKKCYFAYGTTTIADCFGGFVDDVTLGVSATITDLLTDNGGAILFADGYCTTSATKVYIAKSTKLMGSLKSTGAALGYTATFADSATANASVFLNLIYNPTADKIAIGTTGLASVKTITVYTDSGSAFVLAQTISQTSNPCLPAGTTIKFGYNFNNSQRCSFAGDEWMSGWFDFSTGETYFHHALNKRIGYRTRSSANLAQTRFFTQSGNIYIQGSGTDIQRYDTGNSGRLKIAEYVYASGVLTTSGVNYYEAINEAIANKTKFIEHAFVEDNSNILGLAWIREDWTTPTFDLIYGRIRLEVPFISVRARILMASFTIAMRGYITRNTSISLRGRLTQHITQTISLKANVFKSSAILTTLSLKGKIIPTLSLRTRMQRQQGWPIPTPTDPAFDSFTDTRLFMKGRILQATYNLTNIKLRGRIYPLRSFTLQQKARIVSNGKILIQAKIIPKFVYTTTNMTFTVKQNLIRKYKMTWDISGTFTTQSISSKALISKPSYSKMTIGFIVPNESFITDDIFTMKESYKLNNEEVLFVRARIS